MTDFVPKEELLEERRAKDAAQGQCRCLREENDRLKRSAREEAEDKLTAELVERFSTVQPPEAEFPGGQYDGLAEVALPDGMGNVQVNVSNRVPGEVHLRVWGPKSPGEEDEPGYERDHGPEDLRMTFVLTDRGVDVKAINYNERFR